MHVRMNNLKDGFSVHDFRFLLFMFVKVGNKSDLRHLRAVPTDEAKAFAEKNNLRYWTFFYLKRI